MDVKRFADEFLIALAEARLFERVSLQTEGPIASGRAYIKGSGDRFLRVYFNETTGTIAFALISGQQRIWGVDYDGRRGWHLPMDVSDDEILGFARREEDWVAAF